MYDEWSTELTDDPDRVFLLKGIKDGFHIIDQTSNLKSVCQNNYKSATCSETKQIVEKQIQAEIAEGNYVKVTHKPTIVSAVGAIPKPDGGIRIIHDGSMPQGQALNDYAMYEECKYQNLQEALDLVQKGYFMAKIDLKSAYRSVKIHPSNYQATGLKWLFEGDSKPTYLCDTRLPFGSRKAPSIFNRLTQAVRRMMAKKGFKIVAYLDDFFVVGATRAECQQAFTTLLSLLRKLGFYISYNKLVCPTTCLVYLGIQIDTELMTIALPADKLGQLQDTIQQFSQRKRASRKQLQSLAGKLSWACQAIKGGRSFLRRILDMLAQLKHATNKVLLSQDFRLDLKWWQDFLSLFNGTMPIRNQKPIIDVQVDACCSASGIYFRGDWQYLPFKHDYPTASSWHINYKELLSVLFAARRWGHLWANSRVIIHTDSQVAKAILNKGTTRHGSVMEVLRDLFWLSVQNNFDLTAEYLPGKENNLADAISRLQEPGQLLRLDSYYGHSLEPLHLPFHMSYHAFLSLSQQIRTWQHLKQNWIRRWQDTGLLPSQSTPASPTGHT